MVNHCVKQPKNDTCRMAMWALCLISNKLRLSNWYVQVNFCVKISTSNGQRTKYVEWLRGLYARFPTNYEYPIGKFGSVTSLNNPQVMAKERWMSNGHVGGMLYFQQIMNVRLVSLGQSLRQTAKERHMSNDHVGFMLYFQQMTIVQLVCSGQFLCQKIHK